MKGYSIDKTICFYSQNEEIKKEVELFCEKHSFDLFIADNETDLIAVPYILAIIDGCKLKEDFIQDVDDFIDFDYQTILSYSSLPCSSKIISEIKADINYSFLEKLISQIKPEIKEFEVDS